MCAHGVWGALPRRRSQQLQQSLGCCRDCGAVVVAVVVPCGAMACPRWCVRRQRNPVTALPRGLLGEGSHGQRLESGKWLTAFWRACSCTMSPLSHWKNLHRNRKLGSRRMLPLRIAVHENGHVCPQPKTHVGQGPTIHRLSVPARQSNAHLQAAAAQLRTALNCT
jgi:hypothetical protein